MTSSGLLAAARLRKMSLDAPGPQRMTNGAIAIGA
jgi:hypothetical protein